MKTFSDFCQNFQFNWILKNDCSVDGVIFRHLLKFQPSTFTDFFDAHFTHKIRLTTRHQKYYYSLRSCIGRLLDSRDVSRLRSKFRVSHTRQISFAVMNVRKMKLLYYLASTWHKFNYKKKQFTKKEQCNPTNDTTHS